MKSLGIEDIRNLFRLKKELNCNAKKKKELKQLKKEFLKILGIFFNMKKKIITN